MSTISARFSNALLVLRDKDIPQRLEISERDVVIFVIGATGSGKSTFIDKALARESMGVSKPSALASCTKTIHEFKCTSPWNPYGRSVIFVDIPAFDHSTLDIQRRVPDLITTWLGTYCTGKSVDSGILYMHAMRPRLNEGFDKHLQPFITLCNKRNHKPISALLVTTMRPSLKTEDSGQRKELEQRFRETGTNIRKMPTSMYFDTSHKSACEAINVLLEDIMVTKGVNNPT